MSQPESELQIQIIQGLPETLEEILELRSRVWIDSGQINVQHSSPRVER